MCVYLVPTVAEHITITSSKREPKTKQIFK